MIDLIIYRTTFVFHYAVDIKLILSLAVNS